MTDTNLSEAQIEKAAEAGYKAGGASAWENTYEENKEAWRNIVRAAAPYLQYEAIKENADYLRSMVGACHVMISRDDLSELDGNWPTTDLPPRLKKYIETKYLQAQQAQTARSEPVAAQPEMAQRMWYAYDGARGGCIDGMAEAAQICLDEALGLVTDEERKQHRDLVGFVPAVVDTFLAHRRCRLSAPKPVEENIGDAMLRAFDNAKDQDYSGTLDDRRVCMYAAFRVARKHIEAGLIAELRESDGKKQ